MEKTSQVESLLGRRMRHEHGIVDDEYPILSAELRWLLSELPSLVSSHRKTFQSFPFPCLALRRKPFLEVTVREGVRGGGWSLRRGGDCEVPCWLTGEE